MLIRSCSLQQESWFKVVVEYSEAPDIVAKQVDCASFFCRISWFFAKWRWPVRSQHFAAGVRYLTTWNVIVPYTKEWKHPLPFTCRCSLIPCIIQYLHDITTARMGRRKFNKQQHTANCTPAHKQNLTLGKIGPLKFGTDEERIAWVDRHYTDLLGYCNKNIT